MVDGLNCIINVVVKLQGRSLKLIGRVRRLDVITDGPKISS